MKLIGTGLFEIQEKSLSKAKERKLETDGDWVSTWMRASEAMTQCLLRRHQIALSGCEAR